MHFYEISDLLRDTEFKVFRNVLDNGGQVKAITVKGNAGIPRRELDDLVDYVGQYGAKGLAWIGFNEDGTLKCQITKFLGEEKVREIGKICYGFYFFIRYKCTLNTYRINNSNRSK